MLIKFYLFSWETEHVKENVLKGVSKALTYLVVWKIGKKLKMAILTFNENTKFPKNQMKFQIDFAKKN